MTGAMIETKSIDRLSRSPEHRGAIFQEEADEQGLVLLQAKIRSLKIYLLIDPEADRILQAKFFTYGGLLYTAVAEAHCNLLQDALTAEAFAVQPKDVERLLRDAPEVPALADDAAELAHISEFSATFANDYADKKRAALAVREIRKQYTDRGLTAYDIKREDDRKWVEGSAEERRAMVEAALDEHIRKGLNMDGGDATIVAIEEPAKVKLQYEGNCGSCSASSGGTLFFIEDTLRKHVYSGIRVEPVNGALDVF